MKTLPLAIAFALLATTVQARTTHVMIRAQSLDAKFIGTGMGGVQVTLTDARTHAVLAKGVIAGGTGDTDRIIRTPRVRGAGIAIADTAGFDAVLDIDKPTLIQVDATGPAGKPASAIRVSSQMWVIPGRDVTGDGWVLTFPGLVIEPTATPMPDGALKLAAKLTLMCGCPIEPGGLWDSANYTIEATLLKGARVVGQTTLTYAGQTSQFGGALPPVGPGRYQLRLVATDSKTPNAGVVEQQVRVVRAP